mmetsp:Transcript_104224/g.264650  ORF Transcript_104224/g.264650 Transcript_104224/m.264650 type:complete len:186 (+) Transcript_104224:748-1305(+)
MASAAVATAGPAEPPERQLDVARALGGRYLPAFERAVKEGWAQELMDDPFGTPLAQEHPRSLHSDEGGGKVNSRQGGVFGSGLRSWLFSASHHAASPSSDGSTCRFEVGRDYVGQDIATVPHLSAEQCCNLCSSRSAPSQGGCQVAVLSGAEDSPPYACWLKRDVTHATPKNGVMACWPPGAALA